MWSELVPDPSSSIAVTLQLLPQHPTPSPDFEHSPLFSHIPFIYPSLAPDSRWHPALAQQHTKGEPRCSLLHLNPPAIPPFLSCTPPHLRKNKPLL